MKTLLAILALLLVASPVLAQKPRRTILVVPASNLKAANDAAVVAFGNAGKGTFSVPYSFDKSGTTTHYVAALVILPEKKAKFDAAFVALSTARTLVQYDSVTRSKLTELKLAPINTKPIVTPSPDIVPK
jgi:hypothetical protein